nr:MAG TPA: hypothetical protein [Caudoviricetes sp.]
MISASAAFTRASAFFGVIRPLMIFERYPRVHPRRVASSAVVM